ncbi:hypothetical protein PHYBLDRAFT_164831 [Phycomyces blakesleeanus NRRL 1555(-)]|uniref:Uncharacterized protein n=1 Tax=Phycomyces blakesleeanus (strain ATCC 8743b / DSM 1359 / FGSC 10004 / NBRC 33097 / NRRL 1555) TaxID=763407 RepID=A0A162UTL7_PHYB8|nr:hypothetical protein PHYBLDRAFT_164831 [Phycomyces blakesleeanus NRRL 1555(-)]OAD77952.1 hypothetical protein PHYBLDRAFT_164831 [Phycomyces blakesleeanus NRRL 1555(-)]|eukprot:XP_018295992.1 hypothetical protein PHYBLDRAFT_164831 [Phycomyces blakesleeanus NRRL 1555(-)]
MPLEIKRTKNVVEIKRFDYYGLLAVKLKQFEHHTTLHYTTLHYMPIIEPIDIDIDINMYIYANPFKIRKAKKRSSFCYYNNYLYSPSGVICTRLFVHGSRICINDNENDPYTQKKTLYELRVYLMHRSANTVQLDNTTCGFRRENASKHGVDKGRIKEVDS